ncbi:MAG: selenide, water dikinase SelD [Bacteroidetes bacterium RIFCSPLOWO2_12_FULL_35_15]|nr:MAG: selenide, water dikinase SelD [Bacteroidetes bacterium RIFCSPLOWO2_12_FULL_35_15]
MEKIKLTQYSHGGGCGCKIAPQLLDEILKSNFVAPKNDKLIVGNSSKDDAAVYDIGNGQGLISTTDFFMPIVDDAFEFGKIASANAISDVYAMGGKPLMAIAILGWPINKLPVETAQQVIDGARAICAEAGIPLAGGHSIDSPEPIFGLAVSGLIDLKNLKQNNTAKEGNLLYLTKKIGVGILSTAGKKGILKEEHIGIAAKQMMQLNKLGEKAGQLSGVTAMTDVTGFALLGHLIEMAEGSNLTAEISYSKVPLFEGLEFYTSQKCMPGNTQKNWKSFETKVAGMTEELTYTLCDPQTNGGLLIAVDPDSKTEFENLLIAEGLGDFVEPIGVMKSKGENVVVIKP